MHRIGYAGSIHIVHGEAVARFFAEYLNSIGDNKYVSGDVLYEQPLFVKSSITNGFGIFGSYAVDDYILHLK